MANRVVSLDESQLRTIVLETSVAYHVALYLTGLSIQEAEILRLQKMYDVLDKFGISYEAV